MSLHHTITLYDRLDRQGRNHRPILEALGRASQSTLNELHGLATSLEHISINQNRPTKAKDKVALAMFGCRLLCLLPSLRISVYDIHRVMEEEDLLGERYRDLRGDSEETTFLDESRYLMWLMEVRLLVTTVVTFQRT
ncbi:hypothetical protein FLAG1_11809 [Fusarium langsethiae]|uniref:Uncharacterized protein n=1 Tax=Fusarium langsethiae TaxID=179993 RepID=A0A0N0V4L7_FUSLA|nr:hypothetical protein FLAG1_11809 [Fusarium langsethiae]GKU09877.1 unnamed protein product [Fusarium langsethiae]